jgi:hypothetical protein
MLGIVPFGASRSTPRRRRTGAHCCRSTPSNFPGESLDGAM